jgi:hypothetical protein
VASKLLNKKDLDLGQLNQTWANNKGLWANYVLSSDLENKRTLKNFHIGQVENRWRIFARQEIKNFQYTSNSALEYRLMEYRQMESRETRGAV